MMPADDDLSPWVSRALPVFEVPPVRPLEPLTPDEITLVREALAFLGVLPWDETSEFLASGEAKRIAGIMSEPGGEVDALRLEVALVDYRERRAAEASGAQKKKGHGAP